MIFNREKKITLFFHEDEKQCSVYSTWNRLHKTKSFFFGFIKLRKEIYYLLDAAGFSYPKLKESQKEKLSKIKGIIIFAKKDQDFPILRSTKNDSISHTWFGDKVKNVVGVLMISKGAALFEDQRWKNIFGSWVSFGGKFSLLADLETSRKQADIIFPEIVKVASSGTDSVKIKRDIEDVFDRSIRRIIASKDRYTSDERMTIQLLKLNMDNIVCNKNIN